MFPPGIKKPAGAGEVLVTNRVDKIITTARTDIRIKLDFN